MVVVSDDSPDNDVTKDDLEGDDFKDFGSHNGEVEAGDTIKIKPDNAVTGQFIIIYLPGEGQLSLGDVKVYVKPVSTPETPEEPETPQTPEGPDVDIIVGPGEPGGPDGPDGPEEVDNTDTESEGTGEHAENGNDGDPDTCFVSDEEDHPWYSMNLGKEWQITSVKIAVCAESRKYILYTFINDSK